MNVSMSTMGEASVWTTNLTLGFYFALILGSVLILKKLYGPPRKNTPPSPPGLPFIGHLHILASGGKPSHQTLATLAEKYGPLMLMRFGMKPTLVISSAKIAEECFRQHDAIFSGRPNMAIVTYVTYNGQDIVMARRTTPEWRHQRKLMTVEVLSNKRLESTKEIRDSEISLMMRSILHDSDASLPIHFREKIFVATFNSTSLMALKQRYVNHKSEGQMAPATYSLQSEEFKETINEIYKVAGTTCLEDCFPIFKYYDVQGCMKRIKAARNKLDTFFQKVVDDHREKKALGEVAHVNGEQDMVDVLLSSDEEVSDLNLKTLLLNLYLGTTETLLTTIEWTMTEILRNPSVRERAQLELDSVTGCKRNIRESDMPTLEYLNAIIAESFRLHPPAPLLMPHETTADCKISGYDIPANTQVLTNIWAYGRDPLTWENPLEFNPDRFLNTNVSELYRGQDQCRLIPFGVGKRICPGISLALLIVQNIVANFLHCFDWTADGSELDISESIGIDAPKAKPLYASAKPRLPRELY